MSHALSRRALIAAGLSVGVLPLPGQDARAQDGWPAKPIRIVVPFAVGGQTDLIARTYADFLGKRLGQTVIVENKSGASGIVGATEVKRAAPDGYTLMMTTGSSLTNNVVLYKELPYDSDKDFVLISSIAAQGLAVVVKDGIAARNLADFVAFVRKGGKVSFGTYGANSTAHLTILELNKQYGFAIEPVHYRGEAPMWADVMNGSIDGAVGSYPAALPLLQAGKGHIISAASRPIKILPDLKTLPQQGATSPFFRLSGFSALFAAPAGTPPEIVKRLSEAMVAAGKDEKIQAALAQFPIEAPVGHEDAQIAFNREAPATRAFLATLNIPKE